MAQVTLIGGDSLTIRSEKLASEYLNPTPSDLSLGFLFSFKPPYSSID